MFCGGWQPDSSLGQMLGITPTLSPLSPLSKGWGGGGGGGVRAYSLAPLANYTCKECSLEGRLGKRR